MHWVISKNKRTGVKLTWDKISNTLGKLYPNNNIMLKTDEMGDRLTMFEGQNQVLEVTLNKIRYCGTKDGKWHESIPNNSFIFDNPTNEIIQAFKLQLV